MDFIVKRIWYITVPTAMAVLIFQLYWLHNTYINQKVNFKQTATNALQKAYDEVILKSTMGIEPKQAANINSSTIRATTKIETGNHLKGADVRKLMSSLKSLKRDTIIKIKTPDVNMSRLLSDIMSISSSGSNLDLALLEKKYREELKNRGIKLPFKLTIDKKDQKIPDITGANLVQIAPPGKKETISVMFTEVNQLLIIKIIWPILLSFLLILLITGCIWVLWRIIHQQKKLEVMKNDFISNISHELKTPLSILNTTNEVLLNFDGMKDLEKTERYLKLSKGELQKLQNLIDGILALTKMEHTDNLLGPFEKIYIEDLLKVITSRFNELPGVHITYDIKVSGKVMQTWSESLKTILSNLLDNAIKYTPTSDKFIKITVTEDTKHYRFSVIDHGIGIAQHQQPFIFDKFYRVPQGDIHEVKGYGLGLSHVKTLVHKMDARITLNSKLMEGSVFTIQLKKNG